MCYRYIRPDFWDIVETWQLDTDLPALFTGSVDRAPSDPVPVLCADDSGRLRLELMRWGLIPHWWRQEKPPRLTFNARSEEADNKPVWRDGFFHGRCLMPARGWYEWRQTQDGQAGPTGLRKCKQAFRVSAADAQVIAFAALSARWRSPDGHEIKSCALFTRSASAGLAFLHPRMPVVLPAQLHHCWLSPGLGREDIHRLLDAARLDFTASPVD